jgi:hypothetical protein
MDCFPHIPECLGAPLERIRFAGSAFFLTYQSVGPSMLPLKVVGVRVI